MDEWLHSLVPWAQRHCLGSVGGEPRLDPIFKFFTYLGYEELYLVLLPLVYWCINKPVGIGLGYITLPVHMGQRCAQEPVRHPAAV